MSRLDWNGDAAEVFVRGRTLSALMVLGQAGEDRARELIGTPGPPRSTPGSPPHMDTEALRDSITHEVDAGQMSARIGTNLDYGLYLEVGTSKMAARPWLRRAAMDIISRADQIIATAGDEVGTSVAARVVGAVRRTASRIGRFFGRGR
jgi:HK97 gp10 family phage protein